MPPLLDNTMLNAQHICGSRIVRPRLINENMGKFGEFIKSAGGASIAGGAIGAIGNIAGSLIGASSAKKIAREQNEYNQEMWRMQNEYNTPRAQKQRLIDAGLNPALMYQNGGVSNTAESPAPASDAAVQSSNYIMDGVRGAGTALQNMMHNAAQLEQMEAQTELLRSQARKTDGETRLQQWQEKVLQADAALKNAQTAHVGIKTQLLDLDLGFGIKTQDLRYTDYVRKVQEGAKNLEKVIEEVEQLKLRGEYLEPELQASLDLKIQQYAINRVIMRAKEAGIRLTNAQIQELGAKVATEASKQKLYEAEASVAGAQAAFQGKKNERADEYIDEEIKGKKNQRRVNSWNAASNFISSVDDLAETAVDGYAAVMTSGGSEVVKGFGKSDSGYSGHQTRSGTYMYGGDDDVPYFLD